MRKTRRITYKKKYRKNKTIKCRKNTRRCKYRRKRSLYGAGKKRRPLQKSKKANSRNIFKNFYPITRGNLANPPLFHLAGEITQARPVPDGTGLANTFANDGNITPAKERRILEEFEVQEDEDEDEDEEDEEDEY